MNLAGNFDTGSPEGWFLGTGTGTETAVTLLPTGGATGTAAIAGSASLVGNALRRKLPALGVMSVTATVKVRTSSVASGGVSVSLRNGTTSVGSSAGVGSPTAWTDVTVSGIFTAGQAAPELVVTTSGFSASTVTMDEWSITLTPVMDGAALGGGFNWGDTLDWTLNDATASWSIRPGSVVPPAVVSSGGRTGYGARTTAGTGSSSIISMMRPVKVAGDRVNAYRIWANASSAGLGNFRVRLYSSMGVVLAEQSIPALAGYQQVALLYEGAAADAYISFEHGVDMSGTGVVMWDDWFTGAEASTKTYVRQAGVWVPVQKSVRVAGVWKPATMFVRRAGAWQQV